MGSALNLLLDSSVLIWAASTPDRIAPGAYAAMDDPANEVFVSAASAWEVATKFRLARLPQAAPLVDDWSGQLDVGGYPALDISPLHALRAGGYDVDHRDPFDRIIAAQAELEEMVLIAADRAFDRFPVVRLW